MLPKPDTKPEFDRRVGELRLLCHAPASRSGMWGWERDLALRAAGESPLPPDLVSKIMTRAAQQNPPSLPSDAALDTATAPSQ